MLLKTFTYSRHHRTVNDTESSAWGPYALALTSEGDATAFTAEDVWFGDVYLCGGQSNMERAVNTIASLRATMTTIQYQCSGR